MKVQEIMTRTVVTVELDDKLELVKEIFDQHKFHHLLVVETESLLGVISDRDLFKALSPNLGSKWESDKDMATLNKRVHQIMTRKPITLGRDATVEEAVDLFLTKNISCIPVVDAEFKPVGIVSWKDVIRALAKK